MTLWSTTPIAALKFCIRQRPSIAVTMWLWSKRRWETIGGEVRFVLQLIEHDEVPGEPKVKDIPVIR